jgi:Holliday junction resolvase RusA-like endonuclease
MTQRGKWRDPAAQAYLACKASIGMQLRYQMSQAGLEMLPHKTPLVVRVTFFRSAGHTADLDNLVKGLLDSAQGIVFLNDAWIDRIEAERHLCQSGQDRTALTVEVLDGD